MRVAKAPSDCPLHYRHSSSLSESLSSVSQTRSAPIVLVKDRVAFSHVGDGDSEAPSSGDSMCRAACSSTAAEGLSQTAEQDCVLPLDHPEISCRIQAAATMLTAGQRLSAALATIDTIPEQVDGVLQHKVDNLAMNVEIKVAAMGRMIHRNSTAGPASTEHALSMLKVIPDMILTSFEDKINKVKNSVRQRVNGVIQELTECDFGEDHIVCQLWTIPEEVQQIAGEAVEEAVEESTQHATRQLDFALQSLPAGMFQNSLVFSSVQRQIIEEVPGVYPETVQAARTTAVVNVEHAIATVDQSGSVPNRVVMDVLIRAKTGGTEGTGVHLTQTDISHGKSNSASQSSTCNGNEASHLPQAAPSTAAAHPATWSGGGRRMDPEDPLDTVVREFAQAYEAGLKGSSDSVNPGSIGHPELCSRPCLYFRLDQCVNGATCSFCHCPHEQRIAHLGRRHRKMLEGLPFPERLGIMLPVLRDKLQVLGIPTEVTSLLGTTRGGSPGPCDDPSPFAGGPGCEKRRQFRLKDTRCLERALRALTLRSLLTVLLNPPDGFHGHATFESIMEKLRSESRLDW